MKADVIIKLKANMRETKGKRRGGGMKRIEDREQENQRAVEVRKQASRQRD